MTTGALIETAMTETSQASVIIGKDSTSVDYNQQTAFTPDLVPKGTSTTRFLRWNAKVSFDATYQPGEIKIVLNVTLITATSGARNSRPPYPNFSVPQTFAADERTSVSFSGVPVKATTTIKGTVAGPPPGEIPQSIPILVVVKMEVTILFDSPGGNCKFAFEAIGNTLNFSSVSDRWKGLDVFFDQQIEVLRPRGDATSALQLL
jgi:hypothetical protein